MSTSCTSGSWKCTSFAIEWMMYRQVHEFEWAWTAHSSGRFSAVRHVHFWYIFFFCCTSSIVHLLLFIYIYLGTVDLHVQFLRFCSSFIFLYRGYLACWWWIFLCPVFGIPPLLYRTWLDVELIFLPLSIANRTFVAWYILGVVVGWTERQTSFCCCTVTTYLL